MAGLLAVQRTWSRLFSVIAGNTTSITLSVDLARFSTTKMNLDTRMPGLLSSPNHER